MEGGWVIGSFILSLSIFLKIILYLYLGYKVFVILGWIIIIEKVEFGIMGYEGRILGFSMLCLGYLVFFN